MSDAITDTPRQLRERVASRVANPTVPRDAAAMMLQAAHEIEWLKVQLDQERIYGRTRSQEAHAAISFLLGEKGGSSATGSEILRYFADVNGNAGLDVAGWCDRHADEAVSEFSTVFLPNTKETRPSRIEASIES